jgi:hypothetical protein
MANTQLFWAEFTDEVPANGGTVYFWLEAPAFYNTAISVTAFAIYPPDSRYLEIVQLATQSDYLDKRFLHCVVRNNGSITVGGFRVYAGVIGP